ncbi:response regulator [Desulfococcaceae bacterium HSG9]|nr:response regulator [Desulfococcaceae bacterium HSG9]
MPQTDNPNNTIRILAADDEESFLELYQAVLESDEDDEDLSSEMNQLSGNLFDREISDKSSRVFDLTLCRQGQEAVKSVQEALDADRPYAVAFLDVRMPPGQDGIRTAEQIRALDPYIEFVIVTAYSDVHPMDISERIPPEDKLLYVQKPFHPQEIYQFASALSSKWMADRELRSLHADLENRIKERTYELVETNIALQQDIEQRIRVEKERERLIAAIEQLSECVIITDDKGIIQYLNPAFEKITGHRCKDSLGKPARTYFLQDDTLYNKMCDFIQHGLVWSGNIQISRYSAKRSLVDINVTVAPIVDLSHNIINFIAVLRDVTKEIKLEKRVQAIRKMEAVGTLADGVAHDFNNILAAIISYTEIANFNLNEPVKIKENINGIMQASYRAKDLIKQILAFSRQEKGGFQSVQYDTIIKEVLKLVEVTLPSNITIHNQIKIDDGIVYADPTQLHQVLMNLFTNAVHAMRETGGLLEISLAKVKMSADAVVMYPDMCAGVYFRLSVKDTGYGITPEVQERIFEPYFTTKSKDEGTGLGLAVVSGIIKSHGGVITVNSEKGKGTQFDVFLPEMTKTQTESPSVTENFLPKGHEHILFVDDEIIIAKNSAKILEHLGYQVTIRTSSIEALELFKADPQRFDLVISDLDMPNKSGTVLAVDLMLIRPDIPVIICSGFSRRLSDERAEMLGIREIALKPLVMSDLANMIRRVLDN